MVPYYNVFPLNTVQYLQGDTTAINQSGLYQKFNYWTNPDLTTDFLNYKAVSVGTLPVGKVTAQLDTTVCTQVQSIVDGTNLSTTVALSDPWARDNMTSVGNRNRGTSAIFHNYTSPYSLSPTVSNEGALLNQNPTFNPQLAMYSVNFPSGQTVSLGGINYPLYFQSWVGTGATIQSGSSAQTGVVLNTGNATVTANVKGHLLTGLPNLANTKNQRRVIWGNDGTGYKKWLCVYESMGNVWMTMYDESGQIIVPETRLNTNVGQAFNPTISNTANLGGNDYDRVLIGWLENAGGNIEMHLQAVKFEQDVNGYWGWPQYTVPLPHSPGDRSTSHGILNGGPPDAPFGFFIWDVLPSTARPVLSLLAVGNGFLVTYAYETTNTGESVVAGQLLTTNYKQDLNAAYLVNNQEEVVSTDITAKLPAIALLDTSHIFIYFTTGGYSTLKLSEFNYKTSAVSNVTLASGDAIINSIQAATNRIMDTRSLVVDVNNYSVGAYGAQTVDYFYSGIPMYGYTPPVLRTKYISYNQPSIMSVDLSHSTSYFTPNDIVMDVAPSGNSFVQYRYQLNGSAFLTSLGSSLAGSFLREKASTGTDSVITLVSKATSPAGILRYPTTGGGLQKQSAMQPAAQLATTTKSVRLWQDTKGSWHTVIFNFDTLQVNILRNQEQGNTLCAVMFPRVPSSGNFVSQVDSLEAPVAFNLEREGKVIRSFGPSIWKNLSAGNIPGIQNGDVILFSLPGNNADSVWGYEEVSYVGTKTLNNGTASTLSEDIPAPTSYGIDQNYPNPFNPTTVINYQIPKDGQVTLKVFDVLGREVVILINEYQQVGRYSATLDGSRLASGIYFCRLIVSGSDGKNFISTKKMLLMK